MTTRRMGEEGLRWFVAVVEDIQDPKKLGRVKIRVVNEHDSDSVKTDQLLWATHIIPITSASHKQVGRSPTGLLVGSYVFGFYLDGNEKQIPMLWGSYAKIPDNVEENNDVPALARGINTINKDKVNGEPETAYAAEYPYNHVWQTQSGHVIEVDDTPSHERLHVYHKSGTYTEVNEEGRRVQKVVGSDYEVVIKDKSVTVYGKMIIVAQDDATVVVKKDATLFVGGDASTNIKGSTTIFSKGDIRLNSESEIALNAPLVSINGK